MEAAATFPKDKIAQTEMHSFIHEGLQDVCHNRLLNFDTVFDKLEERYHTDE